MVSLRAYSITRCLIKVGVELRWQSASTLCAPLINLIALDDTAPTSKLMQMTQLHTQSE